ncbi:MAG: acetyl/propionyl/methylcrotonyl-CoA carboxylase subunit alpha [Proteobacteria bacterium]|nr:acetyl/propionyl/methylcrotonyl-CoA carboxylase subunit alpha [Pseudomonadota bacterium]
MLKKILIANRGEIARRIIRGAQSLGIATVAVYSDADAKALHVAEADEAVHIGPSPAPESYLRGDKIIAAAKATGAEGIHPGYGFLAENADFAEAVGKAGLKFVGPSPAAMRALGGKAAAKEVAIKAGVPVVPGYQGDKQDAVSLGAEATKIGYPVMIKAVAGGGGRGMRLVAEETELAELLASAQREAEGAFGDPRVLIEKVVERPRHIEVQVFGDAHGNVVHMFERDCTLQRRNQKVIEEAPAPGMSAALREKMCAAAVKLAKAVGYEGAGTVEFLVEGGSLGPQAKWYFIEMNTRLQVEHPVTEEITGLDLVEWQLRVASGEKLPLTQAEIRLSGHAIEARLCAEDPAKGFLPSIGPIYAFDTPDEVGLRIESGVEDGDEVSPFYDSMIAKLITAAPTRDQAADALVQALRETVVAGPVTNQSFLAALLMDGNVRRGEMDTGSIGREIERFAARPELSGAVATGAVSWLEHLSDDAEVAAPSDPHSPWSVRDGFQLGVGRTERRNIVVNGKAKSFEFAWSSHGPEVVERSHHRAYAAYSEHRPGPGVLLVIADGVQTEIALPTYDATSADDSHAGDAVRAPINGKVARIFVAEGQAVAKGDRVAVVEAMKMEHVLHAARDGTIAKVAVKEGAQVNQGTIIASLSEA